MTTIAYKDGVMAADTCITSGGMRVTKAKKIYRLRSGALFGQCGDADCRALVKFLDDVEEDAMPTREELERLRVDTGGVLVFPNGHIYSMSCGYDTEMETWSADIVRITQKFWADGSGGNYALVAMRCGKSARDAVKIACEYDTYSHAPINTMKLKEAR